MTTKSPEKIKEEFLSFTEEGAVDLCRIARFVKHHCNSTVPLVKPRSCTLRICGLEETVYEGDEEQLEAWKYYYLPERMEMEVIGAIDDFPCDAFGLQLVLLLGEDGRVFACEDELLHLVARNLRDLLQNEMAFPGIETFKLGECFEEPTEEEYLEMMESVDVKEMKKQHMKFRESLELDLLNTMNEITQSRKVQKQKQVVSEEFTSSTKQRLQENASICSCKVENREKVWYNQCHYRAFCLSNHELIV
ncbi:uncharacterized protein LOC132144598 [Carassius carassius]|uniref:uncharacterized protein LOC132144598 n=1 Tax=Carassius carassius TaxID=217509 RepID=UPI002868529A|nr:uncharacterized protein LOC132144598 [Carassius carassius]